MKPQNKLNSASQPRKMTSYQISLLHSKAHRIVKNRTSKLLNEHNIVPVEWSLLGQLYEKKSGIRFAEMAQMLGVEAPFVTVLVENLKKKNFINYQTDKQDKRAKRIFLTSEARSSFPDIEKNLKKEIKKLISSSSPEELSSYFKVLDTIVTNASVS